MARPKGEYTAVVCLAALVTALLLLRTDRLTHQHAAFMNPWDHHKYIWMAISPLHFHIAPFCWRVLSPALASSLPFDLQSSFLTISALSICMTGVVVYYLLKAMHFPTELRLVGMLMFFSLGWATKYYLFNIWLPDPLCFLLITLILYCIVQKNDLPVMLLLAAGVAIKESVMFAAPLYYTFNARTVVDKPLAKRTLAIVAPAVVTLTMIRVLVPPMNSDPSYTASLPAELRLVHNYTSYYDYSQLLCQIGEQRLRNLSFKDLRSWSLGVFGPMLLLPLFAIKQNAILFIRFLPFLVLVYCQLLFAVNTERLVVLGFPAIIIIALNGLAAIADRLKVRPCWFLALPALLLGLHLIQPSMISVPMDIQLVVLIICLAGMFHVRSIRVNFKSATGVAASLGVSNH